MTILLIPSGYCDGVEGVQEVHFEYMAFKHGDLVVYPIVYPFSPKTYEVVWINESGTLKAVWQEVYQVVEYSNPVFVEIAVFNATKENPVYLFVDDYRMEFTRDGVYAYMFNLTANRVHAFMLATKEVCFTRSLIYVRKTVEGPKYISLYDFLREKQRIISMCILSSLAGASVGVQGKKFTKVTNYYFMTLFAPFVAIGIYNMLNYYMLTVFGLSGAASYVLAKEIKQTLIAIKIDHQHGRVEKAQQIDVAIEDRIYLLEAGLRGLINALRNRWIPIEISNGDYIDIGELKILFYEEINEKNGVLEIVCDWAFTEAFKKSEVIKEYSSELHDVLTQLVKFESAFGVEVIREVYRILKGDKEHGS